MSYSSVDALIHIAKHEPIGVDISDFSDEWVRGFLRGQVSVLEEMRREPWTYGIAVVRYEHLISVMEVVAAAANDMNALHEGLSALFEDIGIPI